MLVVDTSPLPLYPRREVWFCDKAVVSGYPGKTFYYQAGVEPPDFAVDAQRFETSIIDLRRPPDEVFSRFSKTVRSEIRRAGKEGVVFERVALDEREAVRGFLSNWERWSREKGFSPPSRVRIRALIKSGSFEVVKARKDGRDLVFHSYLTDGQRARLLTSHSNLAIAEPALLSWANRGLHWQAINWFTQAGAGLYDLGGVSQSSAPGVARFKLAFGGEAESRWNFTTLEGLAKLAGRLRGLSG
jgi:hypothetical protein